MSPEEIRAKLVRLGTELASVVSEIDDRTLVPATLEEVASHLTFAGDYIDEAIGVLTPDA